MSKFLLLVIILFECTCALSQKPVDMRPFNLPIVDISTLDGEDPSFQIVYAPKGSWGTSVKSDYKSARMIITKGDDTLYNSNLYGNISVRYRGNTTAAFLESKPYKIKLNKKADLLNRGDKKYRDKDWLLLSGSLETHMMTIMGLKLNHIMEFPYSPSWEFCLVFFNDEFKGLYLLTESIERNRECRIDIDSTGFLAEYDSYWWKENYSFGTGPMRYTLKYPDVDSTTNNAYIENTLLNFESSLGNGDFASYIDVESFVRWILAHELLGTSDAGGSNIYLYKEDNLPQSKLKMGPLWDFDSDYFMDGWSGEHIAIPQFVSLYRNNSFCASCVNYWKSNKDRMYDEIVQYLDSLEVADGNDDVRAISNSFLGLDYYQQGIDSIRAWYAERFAWIDDHIDYVTLDVCKHEGLFFDVLGRNCMQRKKCLFVGDGGKRMIR